MAEVSDKPLVWLRSEIKTPPFSREARLDAGFLLRRLQRGEQISMPHSRPMPSIGAHCHELRIVDGDAAWRIDADAIVIAEVVSKKSQKTKEQTIERCKLRLRAYDRASK
jgi:phage-related protein